MSDPIDEIHARLDRLESTSPTKEKRRTEKLAAQVAPAPEPAAEPANNTEPPPVAEPHTPKSPFTSAELAGCPATLVNKISDQTKKASFKTRLQAMRLMEMHMSSSAFADVLCQFKREVADQYYAECNVPVPDNMPPKWTGHPPGHPSSKFGPDKVHLDMKDFGDQLGPVWTFHMDHEQLGHSQQVWVVINDPVVLKDVMARDYVHSRPQPIILHECNTRVSEWASEWADEENPPDHCLDPALCPMGQIWKRQRTTMQREFFSGTEQKQQDLTPAVEEAANHLMMGLLATEGQPVEPRNHWKMASLKSTMTLLTGSFDAGLQDKDFKDFVDCAEMFFKIAGFPNLADHWPVLHGTPGPDFANEKFGDADLMAQAKEFVEIKDKWVSAQMTPVRDEYDPKQEAKCCLERLLQLCEPDADPEERMTPYLVWFHCFSFIFAGLDTSSTTIDWLTGFLCQYPEVMKKAQEEIDRVVGQNRYPVASDWKNLPYLNCVIKEAMRMRPAAPLSLPHLSEQTFEIGGYKDSNGQDIPKYTIPKGAIIIGNVYAVHHNEAVWPEHDKFNPDRWMDKDPTHWNVPNSFDFCPFGFGRRICVGYPLGIEAMLHFTSHIVQNFEFLPTEEPINVESENFGLTLQPDLWKMAFGLREGSHLDHLRKKHFAPIDADASGSVSLDEALRAGFSEADFKAMDLNNDGSCNLAEFLQCGEKQGKNPEDLRMHFALERKATALQMAANSNGRELQIWYGTESGTAKRFAKRMTNQAAQFGMNPTIHTIKDFPADLQIPESEAIIFVVSTYGDGEPPADAKAFYQGVCAAPDGAAAGKNIAILGLGNADYPRYQGFAKNLEREMIRLGCTMIVERGECNSIAKEGSDGGYDIFTEQLFDKLCPEGAKLEIDEVALVKYNVVESANEPGEGMCKGAVAARISAAVNQTQWDDEDMAMAKRACRANGTPVYDYSIDLPPEIAYNTGDNLEIWPRNSDEDTLRLATILFERMGKELNAAELQKELDKPIDISDEDLPECFMSTTTLRQVLQRNVDIYDFANKRDFIGALSGLCTNDAESADLAHLGSKEGRLRLDRRLKRHSKTLISLFDEYTSIKFADLGSFLALVPLTEIRPRSYTISSSPKTHPGQIHLTVSQHDKFIRQTGVGEAAYWQGFCSSKFLPQAQGSEVFVRVKPSTFKLPEDPTTPIIMVANGAGIAPMHGFVEERLADVAAGKPVGEGVLLFGVRNPNKDLLYKSTFDKAVESKALSDMAYSFSQLTPEQAEEQGLAQKTYVQELFTKDKYRGRLYELLQKGAYFYVCGGTQMGRSAKAALQKVIEQEGNMSEEDAAIYIESMSADKRYIEELFA